MKHNFFAKALFSFCVPVSFFFGSADNREDLLVYAPLVLAIVWLDWIWLPKLEKFSLWIAEVLRRD